MLTQRPINLFVALSAGFLISINAEPDCDTFTAGGCTPINGTEVGFPVPGIDEVDCQLYCQDTEGCRFYQFKKYDETSKMTLCSLYSADYRQNCGYYAADADTDLTTCIQKQGITDSCDDFINHDCNYSFEEVALEAAPGTIGDEYHCQDLCNIFKDSLGCKYWVFSDHYHNDDDSTHCTLLKTYTNVIESCNAIHGPDKPMHSECGPEEN